MRVALVDARSFKPMEPIKIVDISAFNNFTIDNKELTGWKAYDIGEGKIISWAKLNGEYATKMVIKYANIDKINPLAKKRSE